jgi:hypothetical protein
LQSIRRDRRFDCNRRGFLALAAGMLLDPERLLWRPGAKHISIPAPQHVRLLDYYKIEWPVKTREWTFVTVEYFVPAEQELARLTFTGQDMDTIV